MDVIILTALLRTILTVTTVWNTGETGDINAFKLTTQIEGSLSKHHNSCYTKKGGGSLFMRQVLKAYGVNVGQEELVCKAQICVTSFMDENFYV